MQVWPCGHDWIYLSFILFVCKHALCKGRAWSHTQDQVLMRELCTGWGCARPSMPQVSSPANIPVSAFLNHGVNALNTAGTLPAMMQNVLFAGLLLNQLSNRCTDVVQSTKKCSGEQNTKLPYKAKLLSNNQNNSNEKKLPAVLWNIFCFISTHFSQCFPPQIGFQDV